MIIKKIKNDIAQMLEFVNNLNEVDVSNVEATFSTISGGTPFREILLFKIKRFQTLFWKMLQKWR